MQRLAISQGYHAQVLAKFWHKAPMADSTVGLRFLKLRVVYRLLAPFEPDVGSLLEDTVLEILGLFHGDEDTKRGGKSGS